MTNADGDVKIDTIQNFLRGGNRILTTQQKEEVRQNLVETNRLVFVREQVSIQDLKGVFADDAPPPGYGSIKIIDITTLQECGPADCYFGYFNGEQGDAVFVGLQVTRCSIHVCRRSRGACSLRINKCACVHK